jgi:hypothetical protein
MTTTALTLALEALTCAASDDECESLQRCAIEALRSAIAQAGEPFGYFRAEPFGWTNCAETDEGAIALYEHPAAKASTAAMGWRPIATAPKDGTAVLLAQGERVTAGHWEPERWPTGAEYHGSTGEYIGEFETGACIDAWWYSEDGGFSEDEPPTHWMPLPPAPQGDGHE